jgi:hypothetical protein
MSLIEFNLKTIWSEWSASEGIYYQASPDPAQTDNPYYKKERPNRGGFSLID